MGFWIQELALFVFSYGERIQVLTCKLYTFHMPWADPLLLYLFKLSTLKLLPLTTPCRHPAMFVLLLFP